MATTNEPNNPFVPDHIEHEEKQRQRRSEWIKRNINHRTLEILFLFLTVAVSAVALYFSWESNQSSKESLKLTREAMAEGDAISKENLILSKALVAASDSSANAAGISAKASELNAQTSNQNLKYTKMYADAQVKALEQSKRQFDATTAPLLQVDIDLDYKSGTNDWPNEITYRIRNLGKIPVKITGRKSSIRLWKKEKEIDLRDKLYGLTPDNIIVNDKTQDFTETVHWQDMQDAFIDSLENYKLNLYFVGVCSYVNIVTKEINRYEYVVEIFRNKINFIHNSNFRIGRTVEKEGTFGSNRN